MASSIEVLPEARPQPERACSEKPVRPALLERDAEKARDQLGVTVLLCLGSVLSHHRALHRADLSGKRAEPTDRKEKECH